MRISHTRTAFLFEGEQSRCALPTAYRPVRPDHFDVARIRFAKGSFSTPERRRFVEQICDLCPDAERVECLDVAHNRISLGRSDRLALHRKGKRTLVFGELATSVRFSEEEGNTCPNYWHFSTHGFCPYGCKYCYLAGTPGVWHSPSIKIYLNLCDIVRKIDGIANRLRQPTAFYLGKLQDALALDPLTAYSTVLVPFFARHEFARQILLTKSAHVERLLSLDHRGHTVLSWSVNPPEVVSRWEANVPAADERLDAMRLCVDHGYPVRAVLMPIIPVPNWRTIYGDFVRRLLTDVRVERLTLGGICIYKGARRLMESKVGRANDVSRHILEGPPATDGRMRYPVALRVEMYAHMIRVARAVRPDLDLALCLEEKPVWEAVGLEDRMGRCNCVL